MLKKRFSPIFYVFISLLSALFADRSAAQTFAPAVNYTVGTNPAGLAYADFNGDGKLDLAVPNFGSNTVSILLGNGNGTFGPATTIATGANPETLVTGDFNGDGRQDFAVTLAGSSNLISVYFGNGDGTFSAPVNITVSGPPSAMVVGDFNGDGKPDIVVATSLPCTIDVLLGNGSGFSAPIPIATGCPQMLATADINGDGRLDLLEAGVSSSSFAYLLGNGDGTFQVPVTIPSLSTTTATGIAVGDVNADGFVDIVVSDSGDGFHNGAGVRIATQQPGLAFSSTGLLSIGSAPNGLLLKDFDGDGILDIAISDLGLSCCPGTQNKVIISRGNGTASYGAGIAFAVGNTPAFLISAPFAGGAPDIAVSDYLGGKVSILVNGSSLPSTTSLASNNNPSTYLQPVWLTASVTSGGSPVTSGSVTFKDSASTLGSASLNASGQGILTTSFSTLGVHSLSAMFSGSSGISPSSGTLTQTVNKADTSASIGTNPDPSIVSQAVTISTAVSPNAGAGGTPTGTVTFNDGASALGTSPLSGAGTASISATFATTGTHNITAVYSGDANYNGTTSPVATQTVNLAVTSTAVTSSVNPVAWPNGTTYTATVTSTYGTPTGTVQFFDGATTLGSTGNVTGGVFSISASNITPGTHNITAVFTGTGSYANSTSPVLVETANKGASSVTVSYTNPIAYGVANNITAHVTVSAPFPSGTVTFTDGATILGTVALASGDATLSISTLTAGSHSLTATYNGDPNWNGSGNGPNPLTVNQASTTTSVTSLAPNPSTFGQLVTITAQTIPAGGSTGTRTGSITFFDGATNIGSGAVNASGVASMTISTLSVGGHSITATYAGDSNFTGSTSSASSQTVNKANTTTTLISSLSPSVFGQNVTFTATISGPGGTPGGSVTFMDGATPIGTSAVSGAGNATLTVSTLTVGAHTITASYGGDSTYNTSSSAGLPQTVNKASSATVLTASPNPSVSGQALTLTATSSAVAPGTGTPSGTTQFFDGATSLGTATVNAAGVATLIVSNLSVGPHTITANYSGDGSFNASAASGAGAVTQTVNKAASSTILTATPNPSVSGQALTLTATSSPVAPATGTPSGTMQFFDGATLIGTASLNASGVATLTISNLPVGSHTITANYGGDASFNPSAASGAGAITQTVNKAATSTALTATPNPSVSGQSITLTATSSAVSPATGTPSGTTQFFDGATLLGTASLNASGVATLSISSLSVGPHTITASYSGDASFNSSSATGAGAITQTVNTASTTSVLTTSPNPSVFGQPTTFTVTVAPVAPATGTPTGVVTFSDGGVVIGTANLNGSGVATFTIGTLSAGTHIITANYGGDANFDPSSATGSGAVTQTVGKGNSATVLVASPNPSVSGQTLTLTATSSAAAPASGTPSGTTQFFDGATLIGTAPLNASGVATLAISNLSVGPHTITASYSGDGNFNPSAATGAGAITQTVNKAASSTALTATPNPSVSGQSLSFTATISAVAPATGIPSGTTQFFDGATLIGSVPVNAAGTATLTVSNLSVGSHTITATYSGDGSFNASSATGAGAVTQTVGKSGSSTALTSSPNPTVFGQPTTLTATVAAVAPGTGIPSGVVTFSDGGIVIGTGNLNAAGVATLTIGSLAAGSHTITADYGGDSSFDPSSANGANAVTQTVNKSPVNVDLASNLNPSVFSNSVTFTATLTAAGGGAGTPTGTVTFTDNGTALGTMPLNASGAAVFNTSTLGAGTHTITATYNGDASFTNGLAALDEVVNPASTTTAIATSPSPVLSGNSLTLTATVTSAAGVPPGVVTFRDGSIVLGSSPLDGSGKATLAVSFTVTGAHSLAADYTGTSNFQPSSSTTPASVMVLSNSSTVTLASSLNPAIVTDPVTFTAQVTTPFGVPATLGSVQFMDGQTMLGAAPVGANGTAAWTASSLSAAVHPISAIYNSQGQGVDGNSPILQQRVSKAAASIGLGGATSDYTVTVAKASGLMQAGETWTTNVTITPINGFNSQVDLECAGLPLYATCSLAPTSVSLDGKNAVIAQLTITTSGPGNLNSHPGPNGGPKPNYFVINQTRGKARAGFSWPFVTFGAFGVCLLPFARRRKGASAALMALVVIAGIAGCGGRVRYLDSQHNTPPGTYTVTVAGTSGAVSHATAVTVTVR